MAEVVAGFGVFELVDLGAEVGEDEGRERAGEQPSQVEDADAVEWLPDGGRYLGGPASARARPPE